MVSNSITNMASHMLVPIIPLFVVAMGATETNVGLLATSFFLSSVLSRFLVNFLLLRFGRNTLAFAGTLLTGLTIALYCFTDTVGATAVLRIAQGLGFGATTALYTTMVADVLPDSRRGEGIGYFALGVVVAMTAAPLISVNLMESFGFNPVFLVGAIFPVIALGGFPFLRKSTPPRLSAGEVERLRKNGSRTPDMVNRPSSGQPDGPAPAAQSVAPVDIQEPAGKERASFLETLFEPKILFHGLLCLLLGFCRSADMNFIALFAEINKFKYLAWYFSIQTIASFGVRLFIGQVSDKKGRGWVLIPGGLAVMIAMLILSTAQSGEVMLLAGFFNGLGIGALVPGMQVWMFDSVSQEKRNHASTMYFNAYDIGVSIGAILLGLFAEFIGYSFMFQATAFAALLYLILYVGYARKRKI